MININKCKRHFKSILLIRTILTFKMHLQDYFLFNKRKIHLREISKYLSADTSILSSNCFAGRIIQDLGIKYNTPTVGLWFMPDDFVKLCMHPSKYINSDISFIKHSKNLLGEQKMTNPTDHFYPVGSLNSEIEIHFLHYHTEEEALEKWYRRASRVNFERLLLIGMEQNGCTENDIRNFDSIPYEGKLFFTTKPYPYKSVVFVKEFENKNHVGDPYKKAHIFYKYLVEWLKNNAEKIARYEGNNDYKNASL